MITIKSGIMSGSCDVKVLSQYNPCITAYLLVADALGCNLVLKNLGDKDKQIAETILDIIEETGGQVHKEKDEIWAKQTGVMKAVEVKNLPEPEMIIPVAVLCCFLKGESIIHNAAILRTGKTDLLKGLVAELSHLGADIRVEGNALKIRGKQVLSADACYSWNSEEISLAVLLASLRTEGELILMGENSDIIVKIFEKYKNFEKK